MTTQNYLQIENNVVTNLVVWDGDINTWQPPADATMLIQANTMSIVWVANYNTDPYSWELGQVVGAGQIGFVWDGSAVTTDQPMPPKPPKVQPASVNQPTNSGTTTI